MTTDNLFHTDENRDSLLLERLSLGKRGNVSEAIRLHANLCASISESPDRDISIDCSQVQHLSAAVLQILLAADAELKRHGRMVQLKGLSENVIQQVTCAGVTSDELQWLGFAGGT